ncbi:MAG TPA: SET domain-containing protein [Candidatus Saccharimonadales bacterium]|nr:SET domain-containing protein [Candidatus Saccharimonadales bacterium]
MADVTIGDGKLAGKGVYAARDFKKGECVVPYNLRELTQAEFDSLPDGEWEWTHTFYDKIFLFPEPARYVNHSDDPSTFPDLERQGDYALRDIKKGEAVTINDRLELRNELETFLEAYARSLGQPDGKTYTISDVKWTKESYWASACTYMLSSEDAHPPKQVSSELERKAGKWHFVGPTDERIAKAG